MHTRTWHVEINLYVNATDNLTAADGATVPVAVAVE